MNIMKFTSKQLEILKVAKEKGFVTVETFYSIFSSPISRKANIERFLALGVFTQGDNGKFILDEKKLENLTNGS